MTLDESGNAVFKDDEVGGYTEETAPIVFQNNNAGGRSGSPGSPEYADALKAGMIHISCGSRSRDVSAGDGIITGKAPIPVADLKAGVIAVRANADVIPGDKEWSDEFGFGSYSIFMKREQLERLTMKRAVFIPENMMTPSMQPWHIAPLQI